VASCMPQQYTREESHISVQIGLVAESLHCEPEMTYWESAEQRFFNGTDIFSCHSTFNVG